MFRGWYGQVSMVICIVLLVACCAYGVNTYEWVSQAQTIDGTVIAMTDFPGSESRKALYPKIRYEVDHTPHEFTSLLGTDPPDLAVGRSVIVVFSADFEHQAIFSFFRLYGLPILIGLLSAAMLVLVLIFYHGDRILHWLHPHLQ